MVVEKTSTSGPKQPPLNSLLRKLPDGGTGVQIAILKTCKSSTATVDGHMQRYIDTSLTVTSGTSRIDVICAARSSKAELMTTIDASLLSKGEELINWTSNEVYTIKLEKIDVQVACNFHALKQRLVGQYWPGLRRKVRISHLDWA